MVPTHYQFPDFYKVISTDKMRENENLAVAVVDKILLTQILNLREAVQNKKCMDILPA